jgi:hypothetical protein
MNSTSPNPWDACSIDGVATVRCIPVLFGQVVRAFLDLHVVLFETSTKSDRNSTTEKSDQFEPHIAVAFFLDVR